MTTRGKRSGERDARDYFFVTRKQFEARRKQGGFLECAHVLNDWYGTPKAKVDQALRRGKDVILSIDVQGARLIRRSGYPNVSIFVRAPSLTELRKRLTRRGTESATQIARRLKLAKRELRAKGAYDYVVVNDRLPKALAKIRKIIQVHRKQ